VFYNVIKKRKRIFLDALGNDNPKILSKGTFRKAAPISLKVNPIT